MSQVTIATPDGAMPAYRAAPEGVPRGGVLVVQEAFGVTPHIEVVCGRLADVGWLALAPALFHRQGSPVLAYDDFEAVMPVMQQLTAEGVTTDIEAAIGFLLDHDLTYGRIGVVGFCMGGSVALLTGTLRPLGAAVTFYGGGVATGRFGFPPLVELAPTLEAPWLGLYGDHDQGIPVEQVEDLRTAATSAAVPTEVVRYADAGHGFHCDDRPDAFNATAAADAWARALAWFDRYLSPAPGES